MAPKRSEKNPTSPSTTTSLPFPQPQVPIHRRRHHRSHRLHGRRNRPTTTSDSTAQSEFADLPYDLLSRIASAFDVPNLRAASLVCRSWWHSLRTLREAMLLLHWGKRFRQGRSSGGVLVRRDVDKALDSFLKGAAKGSALSMVDAGLMYWDMGRKKEARGFYRQAAELGYSVGQCNLGISYLEDEKPDPKEAVKWFHLASMSGYPRAQYSLGLSFQHGRGVDTNLFEAAKWYLRAAEGGNARAMYNISLCYSMGEGKSLSHQQAKIWLKRAANCGHGKAQFELGSQLLQSGEVMQALIYLELATRGGVAAALPIKEETLVSLSQVSRARVISNADKWHPTQFRSH